MSFIYKYLMALAPLFLVIVCIFVRQILASLFNVASSSVTAAVPSYMSGIVNQYSMPIASASTLTILVIAPVAIFLVFAAMGWAMRLTELWTSTALTIGSSIVTGVFLTFISGSSTLSGNFLPVLLQWIAFLVQPFCIVAAVIVILATEKFRRSIRYTITNEGLWIQGGFFGIQEHMIPHHQIGRIVFEQDFFGHQFNYGTLIPHTLTGWGAETSFRGIGAIGQKDGFGVGIGYAKGREEGSRYPLDCLYGIPDPKKAQKTLTGLCCRREIREEEQVSYLKKIYEMNGAGMTPNGSGIRPKESTVVIGPSIQNDSLHSPVDDFGTDEILPGSQKSPIIRINDPDLPKPITTPVSSSIREIPPTTKTKTSQLPKVPPGESVLDQIKKLAELRDSGIITELEFTTKKTELLKRL